MINDVCEYSIIKISLYQIAINAPEGVDCDVTWDNWNAIMEHYMIKIPMIKIPS